MSRDTNWRFSRSIFPLSLALTCALTAGPGWSQGEVPLLPAAVNSDYPGQVTIGVDPRVELVGIVFQLAGNPEYNEGMLKEYAKALGDHFQDHADHPVIKLAVDLRTKQSMSCDGPMSLAVHLDRRLRLKKSAGAWPGTLDRRWQKKETEEFLEKLRQFAVISKFNAFFLAQRETYEKGIRSCEKVMGQKKVQTNQRSKKKEKFLARDMGKWLGEFFGTKNPGDLRLVLGFVNGFANYGPSFTAAKVAGEKYAIVGMRPFDSAHTVFFHPAQIELVAHEFCHSFVNPVVDGHMDKLAVTGKKLYSNHSAGMRKLGYQKWETLMYEIAVRACVDRFLKSSIAIPGFRAYYLKKEARSGFIWTAKMSGALDEYEKDRTKYPTFTSFFPKFISHLSKHTDVKK